MIHQRRQAAGDMHSLKETQTWRSLTATKRVQSWSTPLPCLHPDLAPGRDPRESPDLSLEAQWGRPPLPPGTGCLTFLRLWNSWCAAARMKTCCSNEDILLILSMSTNIRVCVCRNSVRRQRDRKLPDVDPKSGCAQTLKCSQIYFLPPPPTPPPHSLCERRKKETFLTSLPSLLSFLCAQLCWLRTAEQPPERGSTGAGDREQKGGLGLGGKPESGLSSSPSRFFPFRLSSIACRWRWPTISGTARLKKKKSPQRRTETFLCF